jgi:hypothetical protein
MSDPRRLLHHGADDFERELLASALSDSGSERVLRRTLLSIGTGTAVTLATAASAQAASAGAPVLGASLVLKWLGFGAAIGLVTAGGADFVARTPAPATDTVRVAAQERPALGPSPETEARPANPNAPQTAPGELARLAQDSRANGPAGVAPARQASSPPPGPVEQGAQTHALPAEAPPSEALLREVRALDAAKASLEHGDPRSALDALERHGRAFPSAALAPEADVLRVRSLLAAGDRSAAAAMARRVIARDPKGPHARVVRSLLPELGSNP